MMNGDIPHVTEMVAPPHLDHIDTTYSGWRFQLDGTQSLHLDGFDNPALAFGDEENDLLKLINGTESNARLSCQSNDAPLRSLSVTVPKVGNGELNIWEGVIKKPRVETIGVKPWKWFGENMQVMANLIRFKFCGMLVNVIIDGKAKPNWEQGKEMYGKRFGQLPCSCAKYTENIYGGNDLRRSSFAG